MVIRLEKVQISHSMAKQMREDKKMNQGPQLRPARIVNKQHKEVTTGKLYIFTLEFQDTDDLPTDWSAFSDTQAGKMYDTVQEGEMWTVSVTTAANLKKPGEVHHNITEFVEILEESDRPKPIKPDIPEENEAIGVPYPPDDSTWWETRMMQGLTAKDININIAVALKAVADLIVAKAAQPELYDPANAFDDLVEQTRRVCREVYMMPFADRNKENE